MRADPDRLQDQRDAELDKAATFYDRMAVEYDGKVDDSSVSRAVRDAVRSRVSTLAGPGNTILDFGCGTGTDAAWYANRGHRVVAYDISTGMLDVLQARCADEIARGRVIPVTGSLRDLELTLQPLSPMSAIAANFAVLNHVADLGPLFRALSTYLRPGGALIASVLNPWYWGDVRLRSWWRALLGSFRTGAITLHGAVTTHRHFVRTIRRMARPYLSIVDVTFSEVPGPSPRGRTMWRGRMSSQYLFIVLRRNG